jgi:homoserine dehydrogenase
MRKVKVGIVGLGTVGSGVVEILARHGDEFRRHAGVDIEIARFCDRDMARATALGLAESAFTDDYLQIVNDSDIEVVIELVGGTGIARTVVLDALRAGKSVVTANKALLANFGEEVMDAAHANGVDILFEAAVGGGIPIISPLKHVLVSNEITRVLGIVNGTTNYMLTRMAEDGLDYAAALAEAQAKGFAEADPSADVDGLDAAAKIAILASIAFNSRVAMSQVPAEGIRPITPADIEYARQMGYSVKLLAIAGRVDGSIDIRVHPTLIRSSHPLASVGGVYNAIYVVGDSVGETMFFGEGAGSLPAASAVVGDVIEVARHIQSGCTALIGCTCTDALRVRDLGELETAYYIRLRVADKPGVLAATASVFGEHGVSLASVIQKAAEGGEAELVYVTHVAAESAVQAALVKIRANGDVHEIGTVLRVEEL